VPVRDLLLTLGPGQRHLVGVDDDDEVAAVDVRGEGGLVLAAQQRGSVAGQAAQNDVSRVNDVPGAHGIVGFGSVRTHCRKPSFLCWSTGLTAHRQDESWMCRSPRSLLRW